MSCLIQIVPEIPPDVGGVGAHAERLQKALAELDWETLFLAPRRDGRPKRENVVEIGASAEELVKALWSQPSREVLLHYVGYGYDGRGCPEWLVAGLEQCRERIRLTVHFHELQLSGPPWTVRFWLLPKQKSLIRRLARLGIHCLVSSPGGQRDLREIDRGVESRIVATPSSIGEPSRESFPTSRPAQAIVLGLPPVRSRVYGKGRESLEEFCRLAGIDVVHDVGPQTTQRPASLGTTRVEAHGVLSNDLLSALLLQCRVLITSYPSDVAAKSSLIAAGMSHGCAIYNCAESAPPADAWSEWRASHWDGADWQIAGEAAYATYHSRRSWSVAMKEVLVCLRA